MIAVNVIQLLIAWLATLVFGGLGWAEFDPKGWSHFKELTGPAAAGAYAEVPVDREVWSRSAARDLRDVRVTTAEHQETPFIIRQEPEHVQVQEVPVTLLNRAVTPGQYTSCVVDFGGTGHRTNRLIIHSPNQQFGRKVWVEGSDDNASWKVLVKDAYIFDIRNTTGYSRMMEVAFPLSAFRYLRLKIWQMDESDPFTVERVTVRREEIKPGRASRSAFTAWTAREDAKEKTSTWVVDRGSAGLPVHRVDVKVGEKNYHRHLRVDVSDDQEHWTPLTAGAVLYDYEGATPSSRQVSFTGSEGFGRYVRVTVWNGDNAPLTMKEIVLTAWERLVTFQPTPGVSYKLWVGKTKAAHPQYELAALAPRVITKTAAWQAGAEKVNPQYVAPKLPMTERKPLVWTVLLAVTGVLLFFMWQMFQRVIGESPQRGA